MRIIILSMLISLFSSIAAVAQENKETSNVYQQSLVSLTHLNENGAFDLTVVKQYESKDASTLYQQGLVALSDFVGSDNMSKANIDVSNKDANLIVYKGESYMGSTKDHKVFAVFTLKVRAKDNKVQYIWTVPSLHLYALSEPYINEIVFMKEITPEYTLLTHDKDYINAQLQSISKIKEMTKRLNKVTSSLRFAGDVNEHIKQLQNNLENKMKTALDDDF